MIFKYSILSMLVICAVQSRALFADPDTHGNPNSASAPIAVPQNGDPNSDLVAIKVSDARNKDDQTLDRANARFAEQEGAATKEYLESAKELESVVNSVTDRMGDPTLAGQFRKAIQDLMEVSTYEYTDEKGEKHTYGERSEVGGKDNALRNLEALIPKTGKPEDIALLKKAVKVIEASREKLGDMRAKEYDDIIKKMQEAAKARAEQVAKGVTPDKSNLRDDLRKITMTADDIRKRIADQKVADRIDQWAKDSANHKFKSDAESRAALRNILQEGHVRGKADYWLYAMSSVEKYNLMRELAPPTPTGRIGMQMIGDAGLINNAIGMIPPSLKPTADQIGLVAGVTAGFAFGGVAGATNAVANYFFGGTGSSSGMATQSMTNASGTLSGSESEKPSRLVTNTDTSKPFDSGNVEDVISEGNSKDVANSSSKPATGNGGSSFNPESGRLPTSQGSTATNNSAAAKPATTAQAKTPSSSVLDQESGPATRALGPVDSHLPGSKTTPSSALTSRGVKSGNTIANGDESEEDDQPMILKSKPKKAISSSTFLSPIVSASSAKTAPTTAVGGKVAFGPAAPPSYDTYTGTSTTAGVFTPSKTAFFDDPDKVQTAIGKTTPTGELINGSQPTGGTSTAEIRPYEAGITGFTPGLFSLRNGGTSSSFNPQPLVYSGEEYQPSKPNVTTVQTSKAQKFGSDFSDILVSGLSADSEVVNTVGIASEPKANRGIASVSDSDETDTSEDNTYVYIMNKKGGFQQFLRPKYLSKEDLLAISGIIAYAPQKPAVQNSTFPALLSAGTLSSLTNKASMGLADFVNSMTRGFASGKIKAPAAAKTANKTASSGK